MKLILYIFLFASSSLFAQEDLEEFLPLDHQESEKEFLHDFRKIKEVVPNFEKLYFSSNWVFPMQYDTIINACSVACYYDGEEYYLVGKQITTKEKLYYFGILTKNDSVVSTVRWQENMVSYSPSEYKFMEIDFFAPKIFGDYRMHITHKSDSICLTKDELRIFSEKRQKVRKKIDSNPIKKISQPFSTYQFEHFYLGDNVAIYWVEVTPYLWGELLVGTERYFLTGELVDQELIFNVYDEMGESNGIVVLTGDNSKDRTLTFKNNCDDLINAKLYPREIKSISDKFGDVVLPSQQGGWSGSGSNNGF